MKSIVTLSEIREHPVVVGILGSLSGWASFDLLRAAQIFAGLAAGLVSVCTLAIVLPKAIQEVRSWPKRLRAWRDNSK